MWRWDVLTLPSGSLLSTVSVAVNSPVASFERQLLMPARTTESKSDDDAGSVPRWLAFEGRVGRPSPLFVSCPAQRPIAKGRIAESSATERQARCSHGNVFAMPKASDNDQMAIQRNIRRGLGSQLHSCPDTLGDALSVPQRSRRHSGLHGTLWSAAAGLGLRNVKRKAHCQATKRSTGVAKNTTELAYSTFKHTATMLGRQTRNQSRVTRRITPRRFVVVTGCFECKTCTAALSTKSFKHTAIAIAIAEWTTRHG